MKRKNLIIFIAINSVFFLGIMGLIYFKNPVAVVQEKYVTHDEFEGKVDNIVNRIYKKYDAKFKKVNKKIVDNHKEVKDEFLVCLHGIEKAIDEK